MACPTGVWAHADRASGGRKTPRKHLLLRVCGFGSACMNFSIWNARCPWIPEFAQSDVINYVQVAPYATTSCTFPFWFCSWYNSWLHWSLKCWSEYINEEILSKELYSAGFRLFFEGYYLQTLLFFPRSSWLFCSVGMTPWKYYTSSLAWLVWQKSEKIRFITKTAVISFQSKERTEEGKLWTWTFAAYMLPKLEELVCSV